MNRQNIAVIICHQVSCGQSIFLVISWLYIDVRPGNAAVRISRFWGDYAKYSFGL